MVCVCKVLSNTVQDENQDKLTGLFSDAEENGGVEEVDDDLLAII